MSNEQLFQQASTELTDVLDTKETRRDFERALAGDGNGVINVPGRPLFIYARLQGDPSRLVSAFNPFLALAEDVPIILLKKYDRNRVVGYEVQGISSEVQWGGFTPVTYPPHAHSHETDGSGTGGWDPVFVFPRMLTMLLVNAQLAPDLTVRVGAGYYSINGELYYYAGGNSGAFTPPGSGARYDVLTLDASGVLHIEVGALAVPPVAFTLEPDRVPLAAVYLVFGQTTITEGDLFDVRPFFSIASGGGGGGASHAHALMRWEASAAQTDFTLPDTALQLETVSDNGVISDPLTYDLSADGTTLVFTSGRTATHIILATYIVASI